MLLPTEAPPLKRRGLRGSRGSTLGFIVRKFLHTTGDGDVHGGVQDGSLPRESSPKRGSARATPSGVTTVLQVLGARENEPESSDATTGERRKSELENKDCTNQDHVAKAIDDSTSRHAARTTGCTS